jgi:serine protease SohB
MGVSGRARPTLYGGFVPDSLAEYLLFLAKALTLAVLLAALVIGLAIGLTRIRGRARPRSRLVVTDLAERYDRQSLTLRAGVLPRRSGRAVVKAARRNAKAAARTAPAKPRLFVIDFVGDLRASRVAGLREEVTAILSLATPQDEVLVRLRNPGGLVNDQGLAASQLLRLRRRGIPLTVAVDTVAASGGYLMACVANRIVAAPFAVIGSIGVITQVPNFARLLDRAGVDVEQFTGGRYKRTVTMFGHTTDEDREKLGDQIRDVHLLFQEFVAEHRPQVDLEQVATGEYWYGTRALELRLVDELITSDDYLLAARERAGLFAVRYSPPRSMRRRMSAAAEGLAQLTVR